MIVIVQVGLSFNLDATEELNASRGDALKGSDTNRNEGAKESPHTQVMTKEEVVHETVE